MREWLKDTRVRTRGGVRLGIITKVDDKFVYVEWEDETTSHVSRSLVDDILEKVDYVDKE